MHPSSAPTSVDQRLAGKTALVTGAGTGIGRAIAVGLAAAGADVVVNDCTRETGADDTVAAIAALGRRGVYLEADVSAPAQIDAMLGEIERRFGGLDVLVNNAGITGWAPVLETTEALWDRVIDTNLKGTFFCSVGAAKLMRARGGGAIVNVSTVCADRVVPGVAAYGASKAGIQMLTRYLAVELASLGVRVNAFAPGATLVERNLRDDPDYERNWGEVAPSGRVAAPADMVGPAVFLASDDARHVTGQLFVVDGGWTLRGNVPAPSVERAVERARTDGR
jgi:NAD(P)-dependent dehydrogenase (short-subunit alcohol dehydrogenase family)